MAKFDIIDIDNSWNDVADWLVNLSIDDYNSAGFQYFQRRTKIKRGGVICRVMSITIENENQAAYFKLRWGNYLVDDFPNG